MTKRYLFFAVILFSLSAYSQNSFVLKGKVLDKTTQVPLESATVYLTTAIDSTVIDYTITDRNGMFSINVKATNKPIFLKISFMGFQTFKEALTTVTADRDFGIIRLGESGNLLGEVIVKSEAPPIRIKNDTLEFNASSFKVRPDSNVETLLKQLPGVEIDAEGKITVNGKEVNQVLVNGKPFFDKDGKIALQNLPSDIINKVQITDSKTKQEEIAGKKAASDTSSINLTIDDDKNKGVFGKFMGGFGSDKRYESSLMFNYFKDKRKVSILGSSNNINSVGFSMNEVFDSMGGGRNSSIYTSDDGGFGINGMRFGGGNGITKSNLIGINYADEFIKDLNFNGSYFYTGANTENRNRTKQVNLLPNGNFTTESVAVTSDEKFAHNFNFDFEFKIDSTATLYVNPKLVKSNSKYTNLSSQQSYNPEDSLLNESIANTFNERENNTFENSIYFNKNLKKKGRRYSIDFRNENSKDAITNFNRSNTLFYNDSNDDGVPDGTSQDNRDQRRTARNVFDNYTATIEFQEPIVDSLNISLGLEYANSNRSKHKTTFDFDSSTNDFTILNDSLSNFLSATLNRISPKIGLNIEKKKFNTGMTFGTSVYNYKNQSQYLGAKVNLDKQYILPYANAYFNYNFTKSMRIWLSYWYDVSFPEPEEILPVSDFSNPLNTIVGNASLDPNITHGFNASFNNYDYTTKTGFNFYFGGNYYEKQVVSSTVYDASFKSTTTYANVAGTFNSWLGGNWNKSYKKEAHSFKYGIGVRANAYGDKGYTNGELYEAATIQLSPRFNFTYEYGELITVNPTYNFSYNTTSYKNYLIDETDNVTHKLNLQLTTYWPKHVVFGNDFGYNYNSNIADGFRKDFYLWNMSLGYNFFSDKLLAKVKVYDLLDQNQNTKRTISSTSIRDEENRVLQRYMMFSLTYKLEKFAGKKKETKSAWWMH